MKLGSFIAGVTLVACLATIAAWKNISSEQVLSTKISPNSINIRDEGKQIRPEADALKTKLEHPLSADEIAQAPSLRLQKEFWSATDLRAFALSSLKHPSEGGYFYALQAAGRCRDYPKLKTLETYAQESIGKIVEMTGTISAETLKAVESFRAQCASFSNESEVDEFVNSAQTLANNGLDPLINASKTFSTATASRDRDAMKSALRSLLLTRDPLLISSDYNLRRAMLSGIDRNITAYFNGHVYKVGTLEYGYLMTAVEIAPCKINLPCNTDRSAQVHCATGADDCSIDRLKRLRNQWQKDGVDSDKQTEMLAAIQAHVSNIRIAIDAGGANQFIK